MFNNLKHTKNMYENNFRGNGQNGQPHNNSVNNNQGVRPAVNNNNMCTGNTACDSNPFKVALQSVKSNPGKTAAFGGAIVTGASAIFVVARNIKNNGINPKGWTFTGKTKKAKAEPAQAAAAATEGEGK